MAKHRKTIGTGITARELVSYDREDMAPAFEAFLRRLKAADFSTDVLHVERSCRRVLQSAGAAPFAVDSQPYFAERIQEAVARTKAAIGQGQAELAARYALELGKLITEANMKGRWESHALRGQKNVATLEAVATRRLQKQMADADELHAKWQAMADALWRKNEHLSASDVGRWIENEIGGNWETIRRKIIRK